MKKYLAIVLILGLLGLGVEYALHSMAPYMEVDGDAALRLPFRANGTDIERLAGGAYEALSLRGVDLSASMPGSPASQYAAEEDYIRWLTRIGEMGGNFVRAASIMDADFYNALYAYNAANAQPIYLLQGIAVSDRVADGPHDAYAEGFLDALIEDGRDCVDIIHGHKRISGLMEAASGIYRKDVSSWVVGYLIGDYWNSGTVAYTDNHRDNPGFQGRYFQTRADASRFEAALAQIMEEIAAYETAKYNAQRPIGTVSAPDCDFLHYDENYASQLNKYAHIDPERVLCTGAFPAGRFAAYSVYDFCEDFAACLSEEQRAALAEPLSAIDADAPYGGYLELAAAHHTMPLVLVGSGFSTCRNPIRMGEDPLTEAEQGEALLALYREATEHGWCGVAFSAWQDTWERRTWNTAFMLAFDSASLWHDRQSDNQGYGLLAYEPEEAPVCLADGNASEWGEEDIVVTGQGVSLSVRYDAENLYLLLEGAAVSPETPLYVPIDTAPDTGSTAWPERGLSFTRAADFLLCLDGKNSTRLLVQERYAAMEQNFALETEGRNAFVNVPAADSPHFVPIYMVQSNPYLLSEEERLLPAKEQQRLRFLGKWETGRLVHGNADPGSEEYNSLADFCFGEGCVEIRLPWLMLNVSDPAAQRIHDDYYRHYGVESLRVPIFYFGIAMEGEDDPAAMEAFRWEGWKRIQYRERLKESYFVIQEAWR